VLAEQYLQRYRERMDIDDVLRAEAAARRSLVAQPIGNLPAELELASVELTLHRFHEAIAITKHVESYDAGDASMNVREASLDLEVGDYARAERLLAAVPEKQREDAWRVVDSRLLELTGHLADARDVLSIASAYQNSTFDASGRRSRCSRTTPTPAATSRVSSARCTIGTNASSTRRPRRRSFPTRRPSVTWPMPSAPSATPAPRSRRTT
jgi:hypothetical protein